MSEGDHPGNAGHIFSEHLDKLLQREYDRMGTLISRGEAIARTVLSLLTVLVALSALALGTSVGVRPHVATWVIVGVGIVMGLVALAFASLAQSAPSKLWATSLATISDMIGAQWNNNEGDPLRIVAHRHAEAIAKLRHANECRAGHAQRALQSQFAFVGIVLAGVATEVVIQLAG